MRLPPWLSRPGEESPPSSFSLSLHHLYPPLRLLHLTPCHQLLVGVAVIVAQEQGLAATSEQLPTKLRQPPVPPWPPLPVSASFPLHLLIRGGGGWCRVCRGCRPSPTWTVLPPLLLLVLPLQHQLKVGRQQRRRWWMTTSLWWSCVPQVNLALGTSGGVTLVGSERDTPHHRLGWSILCEVWVPPSSKLTLAEDSTTESPVRKLCMLPTPCSCPSFIYFYGPLYCCRHTLWLNIETIYINALKMFPNV